MNVLNCAVALKQAWTEHDYAYRLASLYTPRLLLLRVALAAAVGALALSSDNAVNVAVGAEVLLWATVVLLHNPSFYRYFGWSGRMLLVHCAPRYRHGPVRSIAEDIIKDLIAAGCPGLRMFSFGEGIDEGQAVWLASFSGSYLGVARKQATALALVRAMNHRGLAVPAGEADIMAQADAASWTFGPLVIVWAVGEALIDEATAAANRYQRRFGGIRVEAGVDGVVRVRVTGAAPDRGGRDGSYPLGTCAGSKVQLHASNAGIRIRYLCELWGSARKLVLHSYLDWREQYNATQLVPACAGCTASLTLL